MPVTQNDFIEFISKGNLQELKENINEFVKQELLNKPLDSVDLNSEDCILGVPLLPLTLALEQVKINPTDEKRIKIVELLLENHADPNLYDKKLYVSAMGYAIQKRIENVISIIIEYINEEMLIRPYAFYSYGLYLNDDNDFYLKTFKALVLKGKTQINDLFYIRISDIAEDMQNSEEFSEFKRKSEVDLEEGFESERKNIIDINIKLNIKSDEFVMRSLLHIIVDGMDAEYCSDIEGYEELLELFLVDLKADVNIQDSFGKTPLHYAAENDGAPIDWYGIQRNDKVINLLLKHNADPLIKDYFGMTVIDYARERGLGFPDRVQQYQEQVKMLEAKRRVEETLEETLKDKCVNFIKDNFEFFKPKLSRLPAELQDAIGDFSAPKPK